MKESTAKKEVSISTKFGTFLCEFEPNTPDPGFTVTSPAAPGFVTGGRTLQEAKKMAKAGLEFHCECVILEAKPYILGRGQRRAGALTA